MVTEWKVETHCDLVAQSRTSRRYFSIMHSRFSNGPYRDKVYVDLKSVNVLRVQHLSQKKDVRSKKRLSHDKHLVAQHS